MREDVQPTPVQRSPLLFTPFTMRGLTARNRIVVSPMSQYLAVDGERAYFGTPADSSKVRRLRNFDEVEVAPSTLRGRPVGPPLAARARRLHGDEARAAERLLTYAFAAEVAGEVALVPVREELDRLVFERLGSR